MKLDDQEMTSYIVKIPVGDISVSIEMAADVAAMMNAFNEPLDVIVADALKLYLHHSRCSKSNGYSIISNDFEALEKAARAGRKEAKK